MGLTFCTAAGSAAGKESTTVLRATTVFMALQPPTTCAATQATTDCGDMTVETRSAVGQEPTGFTAAVAQTSSTGVLAPTS